MSDPPYASGISTLAMPISPALRIRSRVTCEFLVLDLFHVGQDLFARELLRGLRDLLVLFGEVFRSEDLCGGVLFNQKAAANEPGFVWDCCCCHEIFSFI